MSKPKSREEGFLCNLCYLVAKMAKVRERFEFFVPSWLV